jgi:ATP-dependent DNA helicase RecG
VNQDFLASGSTVMIEMYDDRVEISNAGKPLIRIERFIDENKSRNEKLANFMRRLGICEKKGSGIDKVVSAAEMFQLPSPDFRDGDMRITVILFSHQNFDDMKKSDRIRACYKHSVLMYISNRRMSNQSLRERFEVTESKQDTVSTVIGEAKKKGLIRPDESDSSSTSYARYLPF